MAVVYETLEVRKDENIIRSYFQLGQHLVPLHVPEEERGKLFQFHGGATYRKDFDIAWEEQSEILKTYSEVYVKPGTLASVNLKRVAREGVALEDCLVVTKLQKNGFKIQPTPDQMMSGYLSTIVLPGEVSGITLLPDLDKIIKFREGKVS